MADTDEKPMVWEKDDTDLYGRYVSADGEFVIYRTGREGFWIAKWGADEDGDERLAEGDTLEEVMAAVEAMA